MDLTFRTDYWGDLEARNAFKAFMIEIHGLDFTAWEKRGFWDETYVPFSYFSQGKVVSSVCIYTMPAVVQGKRCKIAQVSGVGSLPGFRRRGLNRRLTEIALEWAFRDHEFAFLFADDEAIPFYARCGFTPIPDFAESIRLPGTKPRAGLEKLDTTEQANLDAIYRLACERAPLSSRLSNFNPKLVLFHVLYPLKDCAYQIRELDAVVFLKREEGRITVYDVLARELPSFEALYPYVTTGGPEEIEFRFSTDLLSPGKTELKPLVGNNTHVMGKFDPTQRAVFPFTLHA